MTTTTSDPRTQAALDRLHALTDKYLDLVWYARSHPADHPFWDRVPADIKQGALNSQSKVREHYPDEVDKLRCPGCGDWEHGFNSGVLAATRLLLAYLHDPGIPADPEEGWTWDEQIEAAEQEFPELYT